MFERKHRELGRGSVLAMGRERHPGRTLRTKDRDRRQSYRRPRGSANPLPGQRSKHEPAIVFEESAIYIHPHFGRIVTRKVGIRSDDAMARGWVVTYNIREVGDQDAFDTAMNNLVGALLLWSDDNTGTLKARS